MSSLSLAAASAAISAEFIDLVDCPPVALATVMPDGSPQTSVVWCDFDGTHVRVNTMRERLKSRNIAADPRVSLLVVDPANTGRFVQIRGCAELVEEGAPEHLDRVTRRYTSHPCYCGHVYPIAQQLLENRVICRIHATRITLDAIHA